MSIVYPHRLLVLVAVSYLNICLVPLIRADESEIIVMRAFKVEASDIAASHRWRYLELPGYEILSRCSDSTTDAYAEALFRSAPLQQESLFDCAIPAPPTPITAILFGRSPKGMAGSDLVPRPTAIENDPNNWNGVRGIKQVVNSIRVNDDDTLCTIINFWQFSQVIDGNQFNLPDNGLFAFRVGLIRPALPAWLVEGLVQPYGISNRVPGDKIMLLAAAHWPAKAELLPMEALFASGEPSVRLHGAAWVDRWRAQSALFVRWGYYDATRGEPSHRQAFENLVERSRRGQITQDIFRQCFGFGYDEMERRLNRYLPTATARGLWVKYRHIKSWPVPVPNYQARKATDTEVARIIGDAERMKAASLRSQDPELAREYLRLAGATLYRAYSTGSRDPRLLAVLGLYEFDAGEMDRARPFLEEAAQARVHRPEVYLRLGGLKLSTNPPNLDKS